MGSCRVLLGFAEHYRGLSALECHEVLGLRLFGRGFRVYDCRTPGKFWVGAVIGFQKEFMG